MGLDDVSDVFNKKLPSSDLDSFLEDAMWDEAPHPRRVRKAKNTPKTLTLDLSEDKSQDAFDEFA